MKSGNGGNLYEYDPEATTGEDLVTPWVKDDDHSKGRKAISHLSVCYDAEDDSGTESEGGPDDPGDDGDTGTTGDGDGDNTTSQGTDNDDVDVLAQGETNDDTEVLAAQETAGDVASRARGCRSCRWRRWAPRWSRSV